MQSVDMAIKSNTLEKIIGFARTLAIDPSLPSITDWAQQNRYLPSGSTERPGMWRPEFMPYLLEIQENLHPDSDNRITSIMKSTQSGATTGIENAIGHSIKYSLHNILYVISDLDMAKLRSTGAIDLLIDFCGLSEHIKPITKRINQRKSGDTILFKELSGGHRFLMTSYNSIAKLKSFSWDLIIMDEIIEAPPELADQGDPETIIEARGKTIRDLKIVKISTPTAAGNDRIARAYNSGDRREYMIPCPRCGGYQYLEFMHQRDYGLYGDYSFDKRGKGSLVAGTARYKCKLCGGDFYEHEKSAFMLCETLGGSARWEPQAKANDSRDRSYHISAMMSPMTSWENIITDYLKTDMGKNFQAMRNFTITNEGLHPESDRRLVLWDELKARAETYPAGEPPAGAFTITGGADVHKNRIELVLTAWGPGMEAWIFDHQVFFGQTADINSPAWSNLLSYVSRPYKIAALDGTEVNIAKIAIDTSYNPSRDPTLASPELRSEVNTAILFTTLHPEYFVPVKGIEEGKNKLGATLTQRAHKTYGCVFYLADVGAIKDEIFEHIDEAEGAGAVHFSQDFDEAFFRQFASEYYGEDEKGKTGWHKLTERNETLDCFVYSRAAAQICGYDIWSEDDWLDFRDQILSE